MVLACQKALTEGKVQDEALAQDRLSIAKALLKHHYPHNKIVSFLEFLKNLLYIDSQEINSKFDTIVEQLTERKTTMPGIMEALKQIAREEGWEEGKLEGKKEGKLEGRKEGRKEGKLEGKHEQSLAIARELKKEGLSVEFIARTTRLSREVVEKL